MTKKQIIEKYEKEVNALYFEFLKLENKIDRQSLEIENQKQFSTKMFGGISEYLDIAPKEVDVIQNVNGDKKIVTLYKMVKNPEKRVSTMSSKVAKK